MLPSPVQDDEWLQTNLHALHRLVVRLGWVSYRQQIQRLRPFDLTVPQFMVMQALQEYGRACTMSELAGAALQVSATITGITDRLEARGLVARQPNPADRRSFRVSLTPDGLALLKQIDQTQPSPLQDYLDNLPPEKRRDLLNLLESYLETAVAGLAQA